MFKKKYLIPISVLTLIVITLSLQNTKIIGEPSKSDDFRKIPLGRLLTPDEVYLDNVKKKAMSKDELKWEEKLEENLGDFYLPIYKREQLSKKITSWDYVIDYPYLPNVLIIGDSISRGYTIPLKNFFKDTADIFRVPENAGSTINGLEKLDLYLSTAKTFDVIVFNFGIHDRRNNKYKENLEKIVKKLKDTGAKLIFVKTTPFASQFKTIIPSSLSLYAIKAWYFYGHGRFLFGDFMDEKQLNLIADNVMTKFKVKTVDIEKEVGNSIFLNQKKNDVHFPEDYYTEISKPVAKAIRVALDKSIPE